MSVHVTSKDVLELIDEDAELEQIVTGGVFTEGPLWHPEGHLLFSDMPGDRRRRWSQEDGDSELANPSNKGNGMTWDTNGRLIVCEHVTSSLVRMDPNGTGSGREVLATHHDGKELNSPNDVIVRSDGTIYFTDPTYGRMPGFGIEREQELSYQGVYRIGPDGGDPELVVDDFAQPNGLCLTADEQTLYINDTDHAHIRTFAVAADGSLSGGEVLAEGIGTGDLASGELVDGMKLDERGNLYVTGPRGVWIIAPDGSNLGIIEIPENVGNLNWGGPQWDWLYVAASTSIYRVQLRVSGNRLHYMR